MHPSRGPALMEVGPGQDSRLRALLLPPARIQRGQAPRGRYAWPGSRAVGAATWDSRYSQDMDANVATGSRTYMM